MEEESWVPFNYATTLVICFVTVVVLIVVMVCIILICCLIQAIQETEFSDEDDNSLANSFNILSRSQIEVLRSLRESAKLADRRISDQLNL